MKRQDGSRQLGLACVLSGFIAAAGCVDNSGLGVGRGDAAALGGTVGQGGLTQGNGGAAGSVGAGGAAGIPGLGGSAGGVGAGGVAGSKGSGGVLASGGAMASGGQAGVIGVGGNAGGIVGAGGKTGKGGEAGTKGSGGVTGAGGTAGASGGSSGAGGKGSGGSNDAAVDVVSPDAGNRGDVSAGETPRPDLAIATDTVLFLDGRIVCGPLCDLYCPYGNVLDANGCPLCKCNPDPTTCPAVKCKACPYGYRYDEKGCQTCDCLSDPNLPCSQLLDRTTCAGNSACTWLEPGCGTPALAAAGCYESAAVGCTSDGDCRDGRTCLKRVIDPCAYSDCNACGQTISICL
jgi:hypothetical protein